MSTRKVQIFKDVMRYATGSYIAQGIGMVNSVLLRNFMGPAAMGVWSVIQVILGYCGYASLGTTRALARDYPILRGSGQFEKAERAKDSTLTFSLVMSCFPALILLGWAFWKRDGLERSFLIGILFLSIFLFVQRFYDLLLTLLRSDKKFHFLSQQVVWNAVGSFAVTLFFVKTWHIYGLYAGTAFLTAYLIFLVYRQNAYAFRWCWDAKTLRDELKLGMPLALATFLHTFLVGLDKLVLAKWSGFYDVGLYSIAMMVNNYIMSLPMMLSSVLYPNILEVYGAGNRDPNQVRGYLEKPVFLMAIVIPFLSAFAFAFVPLIAELFLKKFLPGLACMKIYLAGTFFLLIGQFANNFLVTIDKYFRLIAIRAFAVVLNFILCFGFIRLGWGIKGVAMGAVLSYAFYGLAVYFVALIEVYDRRTSFRKLVGHTLLFAVFFGLVVCADRLPIGGSYLGVAVGKALLFFLISIPFLWVAESREKLLDLLVKAIKKRKPAAPENAE